jgi:hypothetical protein
MTNFGPLSRRLAAGLDEVRGAGEFLRLAVVDDEQVDALEHVVETLIGDVDPKIHRVRGDEIGRFASGRASASGCRGCMLAATAIFARRGGLRQLHAAIVRARSPPTLCVVRLFMSS